MLMLQLIKYKNITHFYIKANKSSPITLIILLDIIEKPIQDIIKKDIMHLLSPQDYIY